MHLAKMRGNIRMNVNLKQFERLALTNVFVVPFNVSPKEYLRRFTQIPADMSTIDSACEEIGLPPESTDLIRSLVFSRTSLQISDGQLSVDISATSQAGLDELFISFVRIIASIESHDEFALF